MNIEEQILEERLQNWGRWNRDPKRQGRSPLCAFMEGAKDDDEADVEKKTDEPHSDLPPVDVKDALLVQKAWQKMPVRPERYRVAKMVLGVVYCRSGSFLDLSAYLRRFYRINVRDRDFDQLISLGKRAITNVLIRLEKHQ